MAVVRPFGHEPLVDFARERFRLASNAEVAECLGVAGRTVLRWRTNRVHFTIREAEDYAEKLDVHPRVVWPNYDTFVMATWS